jgi:hypothetical protein
MPLDLKPSRIKLKAARDHIERLKNCTSPLDPKFYDISLIETREPVIMLNAPKCYRLVYKPKEPVPETLANMIGDVVGNLKSALDYAAVRIDVPGTYFPTAPRANLPQLASLAKLEASQVFGTYCSIGYGRRMGLTNRALIGKANNENKHEDFIPTVTMVRVQGINARYANTTLNNCAIVGDAAHPINMIKSFAPIQFSSRYETIVDLKFGPGTSAPNEAVVPILQRASDAVQFALDEIDKMANS